MEYDGIREGGFWRFASVDVVVIEGLEMVRCCCCCCIGHGGGVGSRFALLLFAGWRDGKDDKVVSGVIGRDAGLGCRLVEDQEKAGIWAEGFGADGAGFPKTSRSKSSSFVDTVFEPLKPLVALDGVLTERVSEDLFVADNSCNFLVCSRSILDERDLMRSMNDLNCCRSRRGPRLKLHSMGNMSSAKKSVSTILPT